MKTLTSHLKEILTKNNEYSADISKYCHVLSFLPIFENIKEEDYIVYHDDHSFEYTNLVYDFIKSLFEADLVEDVNEMTDFLKKFNSSCAYKIWMREMNYVLTNQELMRNTNLCFLKKTIFSLLRLENNMPGSWGIDFESGNWLAIVKQLKRIYSQSLTKSQTTHFN
jgi:hypothetical protein